MSSVRYTDDRAPAANDFIGLNYYRRVAQPYGSFCLGLSCAVSDAHCSRGVSACCKGVLHGRKLCLDLHHEPVKVLLVSICVVRGVVSWLVYR